jgi:hypothetical protein
MISIFNFIYLLGLNFVIFGFIWGVFKLLFTFLTGSNKPNIELDYLIRIAKYVTLVAVTANFVHRLDSETVLIHSMTTKIVISSLVLGLYLLGKLQKRAMFSQFSAIGGNLFKRLATSFDPKVERFLILGSILFFIACLILPAITNNFLINWFTDSIINLSDVFFFGFIFKVIAFFFIVNMFIRASKIIGNLLSGKSLSESIEKPKKQNPFGGSAFNSFGKQNRQTEQHGSESIEPEFTEYEDVTDIED